MGIKNSKHFKKFGKHTVAPANDTTGKSTNPFEQDDDEDDVNGASKTAQAMAKADSCSTIFSPQFYTPRPSIGTVIDDENSIMNRSSEVYSAGKRHVIHDHLNHLNQCTFRRHPSNKQQNKYHAHRHTTNTSKPINVTNLYHRFGGSIQNLVSSSNRMPKTSSASCGNLNKISRLSDGQNGTNRLSSSSEDYCPSVMFNRLAVLRQKADRSSIDRLNNRTSGGKKTMPSRWKQFLNVNILRKKKENINSRKT